MMISRILAVAGLSVCLVSPLFVNQAISKPSYMMEEEELAPPTRKKPLVRSPMNRNPPQWAINRQNCERACFETYVQKATVDALPGVTLSSQFLSDLNNLIQELIEFLDVYSDDSVNDPGWDTFYDNWTGLVESAGGTQAGLEAAQDANYNPDLYNCIMGCRAIYNGS